MSTVLVTIKKKDIAVRDTKGNIRRYGAKPFEMSEEIFKNPIHKGKFLRVNVAKDPEPKK